MVRKKNYESLKKIVRNEGITLFGTCSLERLRENFHPSLRRIEEKLTYGISIGYRLSDAVLATIIDIPTLIYKHHYKTVNWILDQIAARIVSFIQAQGKMALAIPASQTIDWERQQGHLPHSLVGKEAGLGWIGRSGLLVNPVHGAKARYATILTNLPLITDKPINGSCGNCEECIKACPADAITKQGYDKVKCLAKLKEFAKMRGIGVYICGVCVKVCLPIGRQVKGNKC